jgi:hypothetical protein
LTRIRVRLTTGAPLLGGLSFGRLLAGAGGGALFPGAASRRFFRACGRFFAARLPAALALAAAQGGLAVRAEAPARVDRLAAGRAGILETALAVRAAQVVLLHRVLAVGAGLLAQLTDAQLSGPDLEFALVGVLEELGRADIV